jgi:predicted dehydrogenase
MTALHWGLLGAGGIARQFGRDCLQAGLSVSAIGSRSLEKAQTFAKDLGLETAHGSYEELVSDPNLDIIYVATPHPMHAENAILAIEAGKHVLVEKSFTVNAAQARAIRDAATANGVFAMEAMWTRFLPSMLRIRQIVTSGQIGEVRTMEATHQQYLPYERAPRLHEPELGGGALLDLGIYPMSFFHYILGKPDHISASATLTDLGVDEIIATTFDYSSGAKSVSLCGFMAAGPNTATIVGSVGRIEIDRVWYNQTSFSVLDRTGTLISRYEDKIDSRGMHFQALEVEDCIRSGKLQSEVMSLDESIEIMEVMDEVRRQVGVRYPGE